MFNFLTILALILLSLFSASGISASSIEGELKPTTIAYTLDLKSNKLGNARLGKMQISLSRNGSTYSATAITKAQGLAAILLGNSPQLSCQFDVKNGRAISKTLTVGRKNQDTYQASYDWNNRKIRFLDGESLDMPQGYIIDDCSMPFVAALLKGKPLSNETLYVLDAKKRRLRGYKHRSTDQETIKTLFGDRPTLKIVLEREFFPERTVTLWLSPDNEYLPLKMEERRNSRTTILTADEIRN